MPYPLISDEQLANRLGEVVVDRILDDGNGSADPKRLLQFRKDASSKVMSAIKRPYPGATLRAMTAEELPDEIVRVTLDCAKAMAARDFPEVIRQEWEPLMKAVDTDLRNIATGVTATEKEPPVTELYGVAVESDEPRGFC